jgi:hypothetical protein
MRRFLTLPTNIRICSITCKGQALAYFFSTVGDEEKPFFHRHRQRGQKAFTFEHSKSYLFAGKAESYPSRALTGVPLSWLGLRRSLQILATLAYFASPSLTEKSFQSMKPNFRRRLRRKSRWRRWRRNRRLCRRCRLRRTRSWPE